MSYYGLIEFGKSGQDHVRGLTLADQRSDNPIDQMQFFSCQADPFSGRSAQFFIETLGSVCIVVVFVTDHEFIPGFGTDVADKIVDTKVIGIIEAATIPGVDDLKPQDLLRNGRQIFAKIPRNFPKGFSVIQILLDIESVRQC